MRAAVLWQNRRPEPMPGEICDVSAQGLFIVSTSAIPDDVGVGDAVKITLRMQNQDYVLSGVVRWRGFHPTHQAIGCGIQLDEAGAEAVVRLFPVLQVPPVSA